MTLKIGETIELLVKDVAFGGDGVGRVDDCAVFVPFTLAGERVRARVTGLKKSFATASLEEVLVASIHRTSPMCPHFGPAAKPLACGGCQYQHIEYAHQLDLKAAQVRETLRRIGGIENAPVESTLGSPRAYGYRNKITLQRRGRELGYLAVDNNSLLNIEKCPIADESINTALADLRSSLGREARQRGKPRESDITIRHTTTDYVCWFEEPGASSAAPMWVEEFVMGKRLKLPPSSFFQVNPDLLPTMVRLAQESFARSGCRAVVDAYCGIGLFALFLAEQARTCFGIESDAVAIEAAKFNAERLGLTNCRFTKGKVEESLRQTLAKLNPAECFVILDPPRAGCESTVLETLLSAKPRHLVYISCSPPALARDLKRLLGEYQLKRVVPLDMFPQTAHVEVVAELELKKS